MAIRWARAGDSGRENLLAWAAGVAAVGLSWLGSGHVSLWTDEAATISASTRSLPQLWRMVHHVDAVHGVYYAVMHVWTGWFGIGAPALRLPSALAVGVATVGVWKLVRSWFPRRAAAWSAAVFAVNPRTTWMGVEARPYAFSAALAVWLTVLFVGLHRRNQRWSWVAGYGALAAVSVAVNIYLALLVAAHGTVLLLQRGQGWRPLLRWLPGAVGAAVLTAPLGWEVVHQSAQIEPNRLSLLAWVRNILVNQWFLGDTPTVSASAGPLSLTPSTLWKPAAVLLALVGWSLACWALVRCRATPWQDNGPGWRAVLVSWIVVPTVFLTVYAVAVSPIYSPRYLSFCSAPVAILIGLALARVRPRLTQVLVVVLLLALTVPVYVSQRQRYGKSGFDWVDAAAYVSAHRTAGGAVYFSPRRPPVRPVVGLTLRLVEEAYPDPFRGLHDLTLISTPVQDANLLGLSQVLTRSQGQLPRYSTVWVLRRVDYPSAEADADDRLLRRAGYAPVTRWTGPLTEVIEFSR